MKTVILCGGKGTRLKEETDYKPKPMVEIGGRPILWHIMKMYAHQGHREFVLALGYKGHVIKQFFLNERAYANDFTLAQGKISYHSDLTEDFAVTFAETGEDCLTGERVLRVREYLGPDDQFMLTYGDGVADVDLEALLAFHRGHGKLATVTGVHPTSKYGLVKSDAQGIVEAFSQKPTLHDYVNGGFMVIRKDALRYVDHGMIEDALIRMTKDRQLAVYHHEGFWKAMDTYQEMEELNRLWEKTRPWAVWEKART